MKTLLVKDYRILLTQKKSLIFILAIGILMVVSTMEIDFLVGYMMMLAMILSAGTINYDELDKGMSFLMTLPASRKAYAIEKYVLTFVNTVLCGTVMFIIYLITKGFVNWGLETVEMLSVTVGWIGGIMLASSVLLPMYMKFGAERRRVVMLILWGVVAAIIFGVQKILTMASNGEGGDGMAAVNDLLAKLEALNPVVIVAGVFGIVILCLVVSVLISIRIIQKKEY